MTEALSALLPGHAEGFGTDRSVFLFGLKHGRSRYASSSWQGAHYPGGIAVIEASNWKLSLNGRTERPRGPNWLSCGYPHHKKQEEHADRGDCVGKPFWTVRHYWILCSIALLTALGKTSVHAPVIFNKFGKRLVPSKVYWSDPLVIGG